MQAVLMIYGTALRTFNLCRHLRKLLYLDIAIRNFAIGEKVSGWSQKQFLFWDLRSKKAIADWCRVGGCRLQGEVRYLKLVNKRVKQSVAILKLQPITFKKSKE
jgi:hypothetical protein